MPNAKASANAPMATKRVYPNPSAKIFQSENRATHLNGANAPVLENIVYSPFCNLSIFIVKVYSVSKTQETE